MLEPRNVLDSNNFLISIVNKHKKRNNYKKKKKKKTGKIVVFAVPADHRIKLKECEKKDKYLDFAMELKKIMKQAGDNYTSCNWCVWNSN